MSVFNTRDPDLNPDFELLHPLKAKETMGVLLYARYWSECFLSMASLILTKPSEDGMNAVW